MNELRPATKAYIAVLLALAVGLTVAALARGVPASPADALVTLIACGSMTLAWLFPIHFAARTKLYADVAIVVASVLLLPPALAMVAVGSGTLIAHAVRRDSRDWAQALFNTAQTTLVTLATALLLALAGWQPGRSSFATPWLLLIIPGAGMVMYVLNLFFVSSVTAVQNAEPVGGLFQGALTEDLKVEAVAHASLVATGTLAAMVARDAPWGVALLAVPIVAIYTTLRRQAQMRHEAEQARIMSDAGLAEAQRLAHLGSWEWHPATDRWAWSDEVYRLFGRNPGSIVPTSAAFLGAIPPPDRVRVEHALQEARREYAPFEIVHRVRLPDGEERIVHQRGEGRTGDDAAPVFLGTIQDVTEQVRAEEAMRQAKEAAQEADRAKSQILSMASHDLRTPLTAIQGYLEIVVDGSAGDLTDEQREFLECAQRNTLRLAALVNDLLDLAKIEAGRLTLRVCPVAVDAVVEEVVTTVAPQAAAKGLLLEVASGRPSPVALADRARLSQVLINLVGNAVRFTDAGTVTISTLMESSWVEIAVSDTGIGIPVEALPHIFEEFRQGDEAARRRGGAGLGLAIVKHLVELHGGAIAVQSVPGEGSTFTVRLPAASTLAQPVA